MRALLVILFSGALLAQSPQKYPLEHLKIQGNAQIPAERIAAASGLKIGAQVQKSDFDAAREKLIESGAFESVGYAYKPSASNAGYDATFDVVEVATLYPYRFEALPGSDAALRTALRKQEPLLGDRIPATPQVLNRYNAAIYKFFDGKVETKGELSADSGTLEIVFRPSGERARVAEVNLVGNKTMLTAPLVQKLSAAAVGIPYSEPLFRRVMDSSIRPMYEEKGFIAVTFPDITTKKAANNDGVVVTVTVNEGPVYKLGTITLAGLSQPELAQLAKLDEWHKGETVNFTNVDASVEKIKQRQRAQGFLNARANVAREPDEQDHTVNLRITIDRGPQFTFGKLTIQGLDLNSEPVIRKMWKIDPGQPYQEGYPEAFLQRIREEGIFDNLGKTQANTNINEDTRTVDVTLSFSGAGTPGKGKDGNRR